MTTFLIWLKNYTFFIRVISLWSIGQAVRVSMVWVQIPSSEIKNLYLKNLILKPWKIWGDNFIANRKSTSCCDITIQLCTDYEKYICNFIEWKAYCSYKNVHIFNQIGNVQTSSSKYCRGCLGHHRMELVYYNICNQCLSPLKLWVQFWLVVRCTRYSIMC